MPDLAWNAAVDGGMLVYTSFYPDTNRNGWHIYGGTAAASPQLAALVALTNQSAAGRAWHQQPDALRGRRAGVEPPRHRRRSSTAPADSGYRRDNELSRSRRRHAIAPGPVPGWPITTSGT